MGNQIGRDSNWAPRRSWVRVHEKGQSHTPTTPDKGKRDSSNESQEVSSRTVRSAESRDSRREEAPASSQQKRGSRGFRRKDTVVKMTRGGSDRPKYEGTEWERRSPSSLANCYESKTATGGIDAGTGAGCGCALFQGASSNIRGGPNTRGQHPVENRTEGNRILTKNKGPPGRNEVPGDKRVG